MKQPDSAGFDDPMQVAGLIATAFRQLAEVVAQMDIPSALAALRKTGELLAITADTRPISAGDRRAVFLLIEQTIAEIEAKARKH